MDGVLEKSAVKRVVAAKEKFGITGQIKVLTETAKIIFPCAYPRMPKFQ